GRRPPRPRLVGFPRAPPPPPGGGGGRPPRGAPPPAGGGGPPPRHWRPRPERPPPWTVLTRAELAILRI
ncbi:hypothetical protein, partial [Nocardia abscessus]|uniref:hypothetical protein n=1 Tax=Nocardia abscessus TaxID=120957 RepID=UPI002455CCB2